MNFTRVALAFPFRQLAPYPFPARGNRTHICQAHSNWTRGRPNAVPENILIYQLFLHSKHESIALPLSLSLATLPESSESSESSALSRTTRNDLTPLTPPTRISGAPNETCEGLLKNCLWKQNIFRAINHRHCMARGGTVLCASLSHSLFLSVCLSVWDVYPFSLLLFTMLMMMTISMAQWQLGAIRFSCGENGSALVGGKVLNACQLVPLVGAPRSSSSFF